MIPWPWVTVMAAQIGTALVAAQSSDTHMVQGCSLDPGICTGFSGNMGYQTSAHTLAVIEPRTQTWSSAASRAWLPPCLQVAVQAPQTGMASMTARLSDTNKAPGGGPDYGPLHGPKW